MVFVMYSAGVFIDKFINGLIYSNGKFLAVRPGSSAYILSVGFLSLSLPFGKAFQRHRLPRLLWIHYICNTIPYYCSPSAIFQELLCIAARLTLHLTFIAAFHLRPISLAYRAKLEAFYISCR